MPTCFSNVDGANVREQMRHATSSTFPGPVSMMSSESDKTMHKNDTNQ